MEDGVPDPPRSRSSHNQKPPHGTDRGQIHQAHADFDDVLTWCQDERWRVSERRIILVSRDPSRAPVSAYRRRFAPTLSRLLPYLR
jgi:hypothetical protein